MTTSAPAAGRAKVIPEKGGLFLPYQAKWIKDNSRKKVAEKSRQIGWTWATAYRLARLASQQNAPFDFWVSSRDDIQARLFLEDCKAFAEILQVASKDLGERVYEDEKGKPFTAYVLEFASGRRINSMSSNPDAQAGKRGARVLDEFALHPDPRKLYAIAYPGITWGGTIEIFSTHRGNENFFNRELIEDAKGRNKKGFSLHRVTLQDALDQGFLFKLQEKLIRLGIEDERIEMDEAEYFDHTRAGCPDQETFDQEFMCVPADDASTFLTFEMIDRGTYPFSEEWETDLDYAGGQLFIGVDIGRSHDLTVIWVLEKFSGMWFTRRLISLADTAFSEQERILYPLIAHPKVSRVCIDNTGIGRQFAERAQERFGSYKVEAVNFTPAVKEELAYPFRSVFEDGLIRIPRDDTGVLAADLRAVKKETTAAGNVRFTADRGKNGHADRFWAGALAVHAGWNRGSMIAPVRSRAAMNRVESSRRTARKRRAVV